MTRFDISNKKTIECERVEKEEVEDRVTIDCENVEKGVTTDEIADFDFFA